jgi:hypothetical protein
MRVFLAVLVSMVIMTSDVGAQDLDSAMVFDYGYAATSSSWNLCTPATGMPFSIVGTVGSFSAPFTDLLPPSGTYEATYVFEGMTHMFGGEHSNPLGCTSIFEGGGFKIYVDLTPDADPADAATYRDGELVLDASLQGGFFLEGDMGSYACPQFGPTQSGSFIFTGGSWFSRVSDGEGRGYRAENTGCFWDNPPEALQQMGYVGSSQSWIDIEPTISTKETTWGGIKALFR